MATRDMPHHLNTDGKPVYYRVTPYDDGFSTPLWRMEIGAESSLGVGVFWSRYGNLRINKDDAIGEVCKYAKYIADKR